MICGKKGGVKKSRILRSHPRAGTVQDDSLIGGATGLLSKLLTPPLKNNQPPNPRMNIARARGEKLLL